MRKRPSRNLTYYARGVAATSAGPNVSAIVAEARETERLRIARELHDSVVQPLASLVMSFTIAGQSATELTTVDLHLGAWQELAQEALDALRMSLKDLSTHPHARLGLPEALYRHVFPRLQGRGLQCTVDTQNWPNDLPLEWTSHLYLIVREALMNVEKHAWASEVSITLKGTATNLSIAIVDNGVGFRSGSRSAGVGAAEGTGLGIMGMRERVRALGGRMQVVSAPGRGVRVHVRAPRPEASVNTRSPANLSGSARAITRPFPARHFNRAAPA